MKIQVKMFRNRTTVNVQGDVRDEYCLDVTCVPDGKREPLDIQVRSDRELCELRGPVTNVVDKYLDKMFGRGEITFGGIPLECDAPRVANVAYADAPPPPAPYNRELDAGAYGRGPRG